jgi:hypothetical protein
MFSFLSMRETKELVAIRNEPEEPRERFRIGRLRETPGRASADSDLRGAIGENRSAIALREPFGETRSTAGVFSAAHDATKKPKKIASNRINVATAPAMRNHRSSPVSGEPPRFPALRAFSEAMCP